MSMQQLFEDKIRTDREFKKPRESSYAFLNRSALPKFEQTRQLLEKWFQNYPATPEQNRVALRGRFRAKLEKQHYGAFFELYCHEFLRQQGFLVLPEYVVDESVGRPIDFLVQSPETFYLEATVAMESDTSAKGQKTLEELRYTLNKLDDPNFRLGLEVKQESDQALPYVQIREDLHDWLLTLNPDEILMKEQIQRSYNLPYCYLKRDGWNIVFIAHPKPVEQRGRIGETVIYENTTAWRAKPQNSLYKSLEGKEDKYGKLQYPYVIAVDILAIDSLGCDIGEVLFGKEVILLDRESKEAKLTRSPFLPDRPSQENGLWVSRSGPRNQRVSAVLLVDELMPWSAARKTPVLWHNPWADKPLRPDIWLGPQMIPDMSGSRMRYQEGKQAWEILHLDPD
jgi:hypothetical protein